MRNREREGRKKWRRRRKKERGGWREGKGERMKRKTKGMTNLQTTNLPYQRMLVLLRRIWAAQEW